jgi:hypothetical protein
VGTGYSCEREGALDQHGFRIRRSVQRSISTPAVAAFLLAFAGFVIAALLQGGKPLYADAANYWALSETFVLRGHFSLLNFENTGLRGYALPFAYHLIRGAGDVFTSNDSRIVVTFNAALFSLVGAVLAPQLARIAWPELYWSVPRRLALSALILVFWRGYLSYPLSDFPALAAVLLALVAISSSKAPAWMLVAGVAAGLALNMRPAYLLLIPILVLLVAWDWFTQHQQSHTSYLRRASSIALLVVGFALVSLPQSLSEHQRFGSYSPIPGGSELVSLQYTQGLELQRYDTFVSETRGPERMLYADPHTRAIVAGLEGRQVTGTGEYAEIIAEHPLSMAGVFLRHAVNGLDQRYATPYVEHLEGRWNRLWRIAGFLVVFLALVRVLWPTARRRLGPANWRYPAALLLVSVTALPSAVETRFLLPVFLLCSTLVVAPGWVSPIGPAEQGLRRYLTPAAMLGFAALFYALAWKIASGATDNLRLGAA